MELDDVLIGVVIETPGINYIRLTSEAMSRCYVRYGNIPTINWRGVIESLIKDGKLIELEFISPGFEYVTSLYFPPDTMIRIKGQKSKDLTGECHATDTSAN